MTRDDILEHLQPAIDELVNRITSLVPELVRAQLVDTIGKLTGDHPALVKKKPAKRAVVHRDPKPAKSTSGRKPNSCKKCGAVGFTSATCGKTHNVTSAKAETPSAVLPPPSTPKQTASLPSRRPPVHAEVSSDDDVPLNKVISFSF